MVSPGKGKAKVSHAITPRGAPSNPRSFAQPLFLPSSSGSSKTLSPPASSGIQLPPSTAPSSSSRVESVNAHDLFNDDAPVTYASPKKNPAKAKAKEAEVFDVDADDATPMILNSSSHKAKATTATTASPATHSKSSLSGWAGIEELPKAPERDEDEEDVFGKSDSIALLVSLSDFGLCLVPKGTKVTHSKRGESSTSAEISVKVKKEKVTATDTPSAMKRKSGLSTLYFLLVCRSCFVLLDLFENIDTLSETQTIVPEENTQQSQSTEPEPRFQITIFGPGKDRAEFMTRRKHTLRKVLAGACRQFNIDPTRCGLTPVFGNPC